MATTPPDRVRSALTVVSSAAVADVEAVAKAGGSPEEIRAALFVATPLIVADYTDGSSALALDWYEELRDAAQPDEPFAPVPIHLVTDEDVRAIVAVTTVALVDTPVPDTDPVDVAVELLGARIYELVTDGFRDTMTVNSDADPASVGWRRFARPGACKFCKMLADKGAVYTEKTARFAAHGAVMPGGRKGGNCMCIAGPAFGGREAWEEATPMQYLASRRNRSAAEKARLREYLNQHFPDAPG